MRIDRIARALAIVPGLRIHGRATRDPELAARAVEAHQATASVAVAAPTTPAASLARVSGLAIDLRGPMYSTRVPRLPYQAMAWTSSSGLARKQVAMATGDTELVTLRRLASLLGVVWPEES